MCKFRSPGACSRRTIGSQIPPRRSMHFMTLVNFLGRICSVLTLLSTSALCDASEWKLGEHSLIKTASVEEGQAALSQKDVYIEAMSPFDLAVRLKTTEPATTEAYLRQSAAAVRTFTAADEQKLSAAFEILLPKLERWQLPWPGTLLLVKATAEHEAGAAYCRGPVIVLPEARLSPSANSLARLLAHEMFHVLSNQNPELRRDLYALVGFEHGGAVQLPESLAEKKITNPDAPTLTDFAKLKIGERETMIVPILLAEPAKFDPALNKNLFGYLQVRLLEVTPGESGMQPLLDDSGNPRLHDINEVPGYMELIGRNTRYIIHPEEVLADNFSLLVFDAQGLPTPDLLKKIDERLKQKEMTKSE
jgi:hypothetical protein